LRIVVVGSNGQLGTDLFEVLSNGDNEVTGLTHSDIQVENVDSVKNVITTLKPDLIINTAAFHVVANCEQNPVKAYEINALGSLNLGRIAQDTGAKYLYYSTDYVFDGEKKMPYTEYDRPNPLNVYATTKLAGEYFAMNYCEKSIVIRVSGLYGKVLCRAKGGNFITTMIELSKEKPEVRVVNDEILTPTPTMIIATSTKELIKREESLGIYHMTCEGECSWYEFASEIFKTLKLHTPLIKASVSDYPIRVKRPFYSVLENKRLQSIGMNSLPIWKDALITFLRNNYL
jgi:dTDP-4-dehydrorhamnose reductase